MEWDSTLYRDSHGFVSAFGGALVALLAPRPGERILDLGCGTGELGAEIAAAGARVVGIDASASMIEAARARFPGVEFHVQDAAAPAFDGGFDAVFSNAVLHWVRDLPAVARGVARALVPGGRFVAECGGRGNVHRLETAIRRALVGIAGLSYASPWTFRSVGEFAGALEAGGLEVRFAALFDRPTPLAGREGLRHWCRMFLRDHFDAVDPSRRDAVFAAIEAELADLYRDDAWQADYRRLRIVAMKPA